MPEIDFTNLTATAAVIGCFVWMITKVIPGLFEEVKEMNKAQTEERKEMSKAQTEERKQMLEKFSDSLQAQRDDFREELGKQREECGNNLSTFASK